MGVLGGGVGVGGRLGVRLITRAEKTAGWHRQARAWRLRNRLRMLRRFEWAVPLVARLAAMVPGVTAVHGRLYLEVVKPDGTRVPYGLAGHHLVTTAGKNYLASCLDNTAEPENLKYHACGTGTTSAAAGDTALQTECTTALNPDSTRAVGSQTHSTNTYTTVGTLTFDASAAVTEWGLLSATSSGTLADHQVFSAVNVASGDSIQFTYVFTIS